MNLPNRYQNKLTNFRRQGEDSGDEVGEWQNALHLGSAILPELKRYK